MTEYKNSIRSKRLLKQALISLISNKRDFNDITVSELVETAEVNRGTFYNHYNNIIDIVNEIKDELLNNLLSNLEYSLKTNNTIENLFEVMTKFLKENESVYKRLAPIVPKEMYDGMKNQVISRLGQIINIKSRTQKISLQFLANSIAGTYIDYFENRFDVTLDELKDNSIKTTKMFVESFSNQ